MGRIYIYAQTIEDCKLFEEVANLLGDAGHKIKTSLGYGDSPKRQRFNGVSFFLMAVPASDSMAEFIMLSRATLKPRSVALYLSTVGQGADQMIVNLRRLGYEPTLVLVPNEATRLKAWDNGWKEPTVVPTAEAIVTAIQTVLVK